MLVLFFINIHYFVTCLGYMVPGGCVFTLKSANVFVRTLYSIILVCSRHYLCSVGYRMCHLNPNRYLFHIYYNHLTSNVHFMIIVALHCFYYDYYIIILTCSLLYFVGSQFSHNCDQNFVPYVIIFL